MIARLTNQSIYFENITVWEEELLSKQFSAENPNSRYIDTSACQSWDGVYRKYSKKHRRLARPFLAELRRLCKQKDLSLLVQDEREPAAYQPLPVEQITSDFLPGITLKEFQVSAVKTMCVAECGVISVTTGGGKTEIMAAMCKVMNCPTVIIAEQIIVIDQIKDRLGLRDVCAEPGLFYAGKMPTGELIIIGSIQSLVLPKKKPEKPLKENYKDTKSSTAATKFKQAQKRHAASLKAYKSRTKKARALHKLIGKCEMILVDECDLAVGKTYQSLFRYWFKGRRRYGFCLIGETIIQTADGPRRLDALVGKRVSVLSHDGLCDRFSDARVIYTGNKKVIELSINGEHICGSAHHLIADDTGSYIRFDDVLPGQRIKFSDDGLIYDLENLATIFGILDTSSDLGNISRQSFELVRSSLDQEFFRHSKVDYINPSAIEVISDSRILCSKKQFMSIEELHKKKFIRGSKVPQFSRSRQIVSGLEFGGKFESSRGIPSRQCLADLFTDSGVIDRISTEKLDQSFNSLFDYIWHEENNGDTITFHHGLLDSLDHLRHLHWVFNTISLEASGFPFLGVVERLTTIDLHFPVPRMFLMLRNGKPIIYAVFFGHFLFIGFMRSLSPILDTRQFFDTFRTQMLTEIPHLAIWAANRAIVNALAIIASDSNDIMIPGPAVIPFSFDDHADFASSNGIPIYFCQKACKITDKKTKVPEPMYDIVDVENCHNFYANNVLVHNSGTPYDEYKPVQRLVLNEHLGSVIYQQNRIQVERTGLIVPLEYYMFAFGEDGNTKDSSAYDIALDEWMIYNEDFHRLVKAICDKYPDDGTLVLVERHDLGHALLDLIPDSQFVYGNTPRKQRPEMLRAFERRDKKVLIGGKNVRRGLDLSGGCENLVLATGGKLVSEFDQRIGRARRQNERGKARVFDFLFLCNKYLYAHSRNRLKAAIAMGYKTQVMFRNGTIDGEKFVKSRFHRPRFPARS